MQQRRTTLFITLAAVFFFLATAVLGGSAPAAPKALPNAKAGDCAACHGKDKVLSDNHPATKDMDWKACLGCHKGGKMSLVGKITGSHSHLLSRVKCAGCHGKAKKPQAVDMAKCVSCHGSTAKLAEKTADVKPENPHKSPHYGTDLECNMCHHQHVKSENYCNQCHSFAFKVP